MSNSLRQCSEGEDKDTLDSGLVFGMVYSPEILPSNSEDLETSEVQIFGSSKANIN